MWSTDIELVTVFTTCFNNGKHHILYTQCFWLFSITVRINSENLQDNWLVPTLETDCLLRGKNFTKMLLFKRLSVVFLSPTESAQICTVDCMLFIQPTICWYQNSTQIYYPFRYPPSPPAPLARNTQRFIFLIFQSFVLSPTHLSQKDKRAMCGNIYFRTFSVSL